MNKKIYTNYQLNSLDEVINTGTLFKNIYKPYKNTAKITPETNEEKLLLKIQAYEIALMDLNLYLDIYPNDQLYTVIGSDSYNYLNTWRKYELIPQNSKIIVAKRPENEILESVGIDYLVLEMNNENSSTEIRKKIIDLILS